jgi:hypothetical protein
VTADGSVLTWGYAAAATAAAHQAPNAKQPPLPSLLSSAMTSSRDANSDASGAASTSHGTSTKTHELTSIVPPARVRGLRQAVDVAVGDSHTAVTVCVRRPAPLPLPRHAPTTAQLVAASEADASSYRYYGSRYEDSSSLAPLSEHDCGGGGLDPGVAPLAGSSSSPSFTDAHVDGGGVPSLAALCESRLTESVPPRALLPLFRVAARAQAWRLLHWCTVYLLLNADYYVCDMMHAKLAFALAYVAFFTLTSAEFSGRFLL